MDLQRDGEAAAEEAAEAAEEAEEEEAEEAEETQQVERDKRVADVMAILTPEFCEQLVGKNGESYLKPGAEISDVLVKVASGEDPADFVRQGEAPFMAGIYNVQPIQAAMAIAAAHGTLPEDVMDAVIDKESLDEFMEDWTLFFKLQAQLPEKAKWQRLLE